MREYTAYFDASGHPSQGKFLVVAGYVSTVDDWLELERDWNKVLKWAKVKQFHMTDFINCEGEFKNKKWERPELRTTFLGKLANVTKSHVDYSINVMVDLADWNSVNGEYCLAENRLRPYSVCGRTCVKIVHEWCDKNRINRSHVRFIFEDGDLHKGDLIQRVQCDHGFIPIFEKKNYVTSFQPCDFIAWECNKAEREVVRGYVRSLDDLRESFVALRAIPFDSGIYRKSDLLQLCEAVPIERRS